MTRTRKIFYDSRRVLAFWKGPEGRMARRSFTFFAGFVALCSVWAVGSVRAAEGADEWVGRKAPDFSLVSLDGKPLRLSDYLGKKVVWLNFWGLRCGPCVRELPALEKLHEKFAARGLVLIGINTDGVDGAMIKKQFAERADLKGAGVTFPLATDIDFKAIDGYGLMGAPLNVMIDRKGVVRYRHEGYEDGDEGAYSKFVEKLLGE